MVLNTEWAQVEVIDLINDGSGLAFGIIGGRSTGVVVKTILPGGVADRDGRLQSGDHILQIGEVNLRGLGSEQVASVLRQCGIHVRMVVARPVELSNYKSLGSQAPIVPTKILGDPVELDKHLLENGLAESFAGSSGIYNSSYIFGNNQDNIHSLSNFPTAVKDSRIFEDASLYTSQNVSDRNIFSLHMLPIDMSIELSDVPETETYTIQLVRDEGGLGITVAGYVCEKEEISGIFVKSITKGSAADLAKKIKVHDRIVEVDGTSVIGVTNHQAVERLKNTGPVVMIKFERYLRGPKFDQLQQAIKANRLKQPSPILSSSSSKPSTKLLSSLSLKLEKEASCCSEVESQVWIGNPCSENEIIVQDNRIKQFPETDNKILHQKWSSKFKEDVQIVVAKIEKDQGCGLGIRLEGTVEVEDGQELNPHHYIRSILPDGPVGRNATLKYGDELLEVNGIPLLGLNHIEVVEILRKTSEIVVIVCARYPDTKFISTIKPKDEFQSKSTTGEKRGRLVKAKSETSLSSSTTSEHLHNCSKSLEAVAGLPMWNNETVTVELNKGDHGLGFSILDYQDPLTPDQTVIVIRSLVPGGVAQADGRLIPGDRVMAVNNVNIERASLDQAVQVLKGTPKGVVKITVAKPLSLPETISQASQYVRKILEEWHEELNYLMN